MDKRDDKIIESKVKRAFESIAPPLPPTLLSECKERKGKIIMTKSRKNLLTKSIIGVAAAFVIIFTAFIGFHLYDSNYAVDSTISIDVNPGIEITVNSKERVLSVDALNEEAEIVIGNMKLENNDLDLVINALIGSMLKNGYISELSNSILISVDNDDAAKSDTLRQKITLDINSILENEHLNGSILGQVLNHDTQIEKNAAQYGISIGKAQLINQITLQNKAYKFEDLVSLSINELNLLTASGGTRLDNVSTTGRASEKDYIGADTAKDIVLAHAGIAENEIQRYEVEIEFMHGKIVYEIEFNYSSREYDYYVDAKTGEILKNTDYGSDDTSPVVPGGAVVSPENEETAKALVLEHAKISESDLHIYTCSIDRENGRLIFDIEFYAGEYEYEYEVDTENFSILKYDKEISNKFSSDSAPSPDTSKDGSDEIITADDAKAAVFAHLGISEEEVRELKAELDKEHGRKVYEIEFKFGDYEYEYEVDAYNSAIISFEKEKDD